MVEDGILSPEDVDKTITYGLAMRYSFMGAFQTIDLNAPKGYLKKYAEKKKRKIHPAKI